MSTLATMVALLTLLGMPTAALPQSILGVASVIDGNTIEIQVANGWAVACRKYSRDYVADEERAHRAGLRLWSGSFEMPWDWHQQRQHR
jgi:endonuclease YncB( thermonuclease family)